MSPAGRLCLLTIIGLVLLTRGKAQLSSPPGPSAPSPALSTLLGGQPVGLDALPVASLTTEPALGSGGPGEEAGVTPSLSTSDLHGRFQRVWPEPVLLSFLHFTSKKNALSLVWRGDGYQLSTRQPGALGS